MGWQEQFQETRPHWASEPTMPELAGFVIRMLGGNQVALDALRKVTHDTIRIIRDDMDRTLLDMRFYRPSSRETGTPPCAVNILIDPDGKEVSISYETLGRKRGIQQRHLLFKTFLREVDRVEAFEADEITFFSGKLRQQITLKSGGEIHSGIY